MVIAEKLLQILRGNKKVNFCKMSKKSELASIKNWLKEKSIYRLLLGEKYRNCSCRGAGREVKRRINNKVRLMKEFYP